MLQIKDLKHACGVSKIFRSERDRSGQAGRGASIGTSERLNTEIGVDGIRYTRGRIARLTQILKSFTANGRNLGLNGRF